MGYLTDYWLRSVDRKLDRILHELRAFRLEDRLGDEAMSAKTQEAIDELKAEVAPLSDGVQAVSATVDRLLAMYEEAGDDPEQIRAVTESIRAEREKIVAAALKGTPIDPSGN